MEYFLLGMLIALMPILFFVYIKKDWKDFFELVNHLNGCLWSFVQLGFGIFLLWLAWVLWG